MLTDVTAFAITHAALHVDFKSRFNEREETGAHTDGDVVTEYFSNMVRTSKSPEENEKSRSTISASYW